ncbi:hypothetical protein EDD18DRAFT_1462350 [Armillaria luteobubalina]|uniref:Uncharacterized protein n=1 Tax=Armillaria luteobubalina TaxID=153913 RepID=A0AA39UPA4_9AGAR|nr:hypothetical protein EDD18DRAFT_1462350 [Armillaria luteobubalina]
MSRPPKLCQPGLHTSASTSHTEVYLVSNVSLPKSSTIIWEWKGWSPTTHLPPYFTEFLIDFGGGKYNALPGDRVHVLGFRFRDIGEFVDSIGHLPGFKDVGRLSLEQLFFDKYPSMASLSKAFGDPRLGKIKELTFQLFHGAAVVFPTPVLITLLAHCKHLEHVHFRGCGLSHGNSNRLRDSEVWQHWLSLSRGKPYALVEARSIETISFEDVDSQHMEDVLVFVAASDSPFDLGGLRCLSIPSLTILEPPSAGTTSLCSILKQILMTAREHLEVLRLSFPLRDDMIPLPRLRTLGLYIRKRAQDGTELLRWGGRILANETVASSIEIGFASASMRWCWRDELQQNREADIDLFELVKRRHAVGQDIHEELSDLFSSFDDLDEILAARVAQGAVTNLRIIGPSRDDSGLDWNEVLRGALFPRSMDKFELCRISPSVYC